MRNLQRIIDLANQKEIKHRKQNVEITFSKLSGMTTAKVILVDGFGGRTELSSVKYREDEYDYEEAVNLLEGIATDRLCMIGLSDMFNSAQCVSE